MPRFDLSKYATVAERLTQFHKDYPDGRITTSWESSYTVTGENGQRNIWVIKAYLYLSAGDQANNLPKATGHAFEIDGTGGANQTSALENAESSAIGRCLMVAGYSMNKDPNTLASREEMQKVASQDWIGQADSLTDVDALRDLYTQAKAKNAPKEVLDRIRERAESIAESETPRAGGGVSNRKVSGSKK
jgi:hypothetical protein